jgi:hypothetical protein
MKTEVSGKTWKDVFGRRLRNRWRKCDSGGGRFRKDRKKKK